MPPGDKPTIFGEYQTVNSNLAASKLIHSGYTDTLDAMAHAKYSGPMSTREKFANDIAAFMARHGMNAETFGRLAMNDVAFVYRLRKGRNPSSLTIDKVSAFMDSYSKKKKRTDESRTSA